MAKTNHLRVLAALVVAMLAAGVLVLSEPAEATLPGTNGKIAFRSGEAGFDISTINPDGTDEKNLTNTRSGDFNPSYSSGSDKIAFDSDQGGTQEIWAMNPDGTERKKLTTSPANVWDQGKYQPSWSPDDEIAFATHKDGNVEVYKMNADGSGQTNLTQNSSYDAEPAFSPDGSKIAFVSYRDGDTDIFVMNADGSDQKSLTGDTFETARQPSWSPDGTQIVYTSNDVVHVMNANGTAKKQIADGTDPTFSPDCTKIAFAKRTFTGNSENWEDFTVEQDIYTVDLESGDQSRVTNTPGSRDLELDWASVAGAGSVQCASLAAPDATAPTVSPHDNITTEATAANGATVSYINPTATDDVDGDVSESVSCEPQSGAVFPVGDTTISCTASDAAGNTSDPVTFTVRVQDTTGPTISGIPSDITEKAQSTSGATVDYADDAPQTATDTVDGSVNVSCSPASGSNFPIGTTTVSCSAEDSRGNKTTETFDVNVVYDFGNGSGQFSNQESPPVENTVGGGKAGAAIQVRFGLGGDFGLENIFEAGYPTSKSITCKDKAGDDPADDTLVAQSQSGLKYDSATGEYVYVWKTAKAWNGTCRQLTMKFKDGTEQTLYFKFLK